MTCRLLFALLLFSCWSLILAESDVAIIPPDEDLPIVLCTVFPSHESKSRPADKIKKINALYTAAVEGDPQVTVVDTWTLFADEQGNARKAQFPDLLHPNNRGYEVWAGALRPVLKRLDLLEGP